MLCIIQTVETTEMMQRINYGVIFQKQADMFIGQEDWFHTFEITLPKKTDPKPFSVCELQHGNCYILNQILSQLSAMRTEVSSNINDTLDIVHKLIPEMDQNVSENGQSRTKRGLFDFIGSISKSLFGTATVDDIQKLERHVNVLVKQTNNMAKAIVHHDNLLSSFMKKSEENFENVMLSVKNNHDLIENVVASTSRFISHFEDVNLKLSSVLIKQFNTTSVINKYLEELKIATHELAKGRLSPFLIAPNVLQRTIHHIQLILNERFKGFYLTNSNPSFYYSSANIIFTRNHGKLYLSIKFPISTFSSPLVLYKIKSLIVPINSSSNHGTRILDLPDYFAITHDNQQFAHVTREQVDTCIGKSTLQCSFSLPLKPSAILTCISALFFNNKGSIHSLCDFRLC